MRGTSSSHSAAALRIGKIARSLLALDINEVHIAFDCSGSLPSTHTTQGSDMGMAGGILGFEVDDERLPFYENELKKQGISIHYQTDDFGDPHPNTYRITLKNQNESHSMIALSTGGGMIEVIDIDGARVSIGGDIFITLVYYHGHIASILQDLEPRFSDLSMKTGNRQSFIEIRTHAVLPEKKIAAISAMPGVQYIRCLPPVLPILRPKHLEVPFQTPVEMAAFARDKQLNLDALALQYESQRGGITEEAVLQHMTAIVGVLRSSIETGLKGTDFKDRILGRQSGTYLLNSKSGNLMDTGVLNLVIPYVTSLMEVKSALGVIVAAPTAGSCGCLPGAVLGAVDFMQRNEEEAARALLAAGLIGIFIAGISTFAAEVGGCQVECGAGSAMAAAGLTTLMGGTADAALAAASMALQNSLGMICDPVAGRVEVPCLGKNTMAAANAVTCANMALSGFDPVIPLGEVIETMDRVGRSLPRELRCTALGGLSITPAAKAIERDLNHIGQNHRTPEVGTTEDGGQGQTE